MKNSNYHTDAKMAMILFAMLLHLADKVVPDMAGPGGAKKDIAGQWKVTEEVTRFSGAPSG